MKSLQNLLFVKFFLLWVNLQMHQFWYYYSSWYVNFQIIFPYQILIRASYLSPQLERIRVNPPTTEVLHYWVWWAKSMILYYLYVTRKGSKERYVRHRVVCETWGVVQKNCSSLIITALVLQEAVYASKPITCVCGALSGVKKALASLWINGMQNNQ